MGAYAPPLYFSPSMNTRDLGHRLKALLTNLYFWLGLGGLTLVLALLYILVNSVIMPVYTRHGDTVEVPHVVETQYAAAAQALEARGFEVEKIARRFGPAAEQGQVMDQTPASGMRVKPGRRIYLTVNEGARPRRRLPSFIGASVRDARTRIEALGLQVGEVIADSIPSPYRNTVTQQSPTPGDSVLDGSTVTLWYSTGPSDTYEEVPDVVGLTVGEARQVLLESKLRALAVGVEGQEADGMTVLRQSREPGTRVRGGYEIRLFVTEDDSGDLDE